MRRLDAVIFNEQRYWRAVLDACLTGLLVGAYVDCYRADTIPFFPSFYDFLLCNAARHFDAFLAPGRCTCHGAPCANNSSQLRARLASLRSFILPDTVRQRIASLRAYYFVRSAKLRALPGSWSIRGNHCRPVLMSGVVSSAVTPTRNSLKQRWARRPLPSRRRLRVPLATGRDWTQRSRSNGVRVAADRTRRSTLE